jgi:hypothetical protein
VTSSPALPPRCPARGATDLQGDLEQYRPARRTPPRLASRCG